MNQHQRINIKASTHWVNLSIAINPMSHQFGWNSSTAGLVQSSFFWGYALSQLPGGWLAKLLGGRVQLLKVIENRKKALQKEQAMVFTRTATAGYDILYIISCCLITICGCRWIEKQVIIALGAGSWDAIFNKGNIPAFALAFVFAFACAIVGLFKLPRFSPSNFKASTDDMH